jgi:hypothetical protein
MKMDFIYKTMEIIDIGGGKYQLLNHNGELMYQGTKEQCLDIQERMNEMSSYEGEYMDIMRSRNQYKK